MTSLEIKNKIYEAIKHLYDESEAKQIAKYYLEDKGIGHLGLSNAEANKFYLDLERLAKSEPLQYITGVSHFYGYKYNVDSSVLIPRPETEELVYEAIKLLKLNKQINNILDIGTGSGCIINTIGLKSKNGLNLVGIDMSESALGIAKQNAKHHKVNATFIKSDFLNETEWYTFHQPDMIISNPPYISTKESDEMKINVLQYEPHIALFSHEDPLIFYKKIAVFGKTLLKMPIILCEINEHFGNETIQVFVNEGYKNIDLLKDLQGKDRIIKVTPDGV